MLEALMHFLVARVPAPNPEPVLHVVWELVQQVAAFLLTLLTIWAVGGKKMWRRWEAKREAERVARDEQRAVEVAEQAAKVMEPLQDQVEEIRKQVEAIHHTTHTNGNADKPKTLRDEVGAVGVKVDAAIGAIGAIAVNQANLADRVDAHEQEGEEFLRNARTALAEQGIRLPELEAGD